MINSRIALSTLACCIAAEPALAGELHLLGAVPFAHATGVSADGSVAVGFDTGSYWYWNAADWVVPLSGTVGPGAGVGGTACVTDDGSRMTCSTLVDVGGVIKAESTTYTFDTAEFDPIGSWGYNCDIERNGAWGMSGDGTTIVGLSWDNGCAARAYSYRESTGIVNLGTLYFFKPTRANACSTNGNTIGGWNDDYNGFRQGAIWINGVETLLTAPPPAGSTTPVKLREALAVSGNGTWVGGLGKTSLDAGAPWRWSVATGYQSLGVQPVTGAGGVTDMNSDGTKILCYMGFAAAYGEGFIWIEGRGYVPLEEYAAEHGVTIDPAVRLALPMAISADELTIVGTARGSFGTSPFVLDLHPSTPPCPADINDDQLVDGLDLTAVLSGWGDCPFGSDCPADINDDTFVDGLDLTAVLSGWGACP